MDILVTIKGRKKGFSKTFKNVEFCEVNWEDKVEILSYDEKGNLHYETINFKPTDAVEIKRF